MTSGNCIFNILQVAEDTFNNLAELRTVNLFFSQKALTSDFQRTSYVIYKNLKKQLWVCIQNSPINKRFTHTT